MKDWLKKWYNNQFEQIDISPSSKVWDNISESLEEWPKHWYKTNTNDLKTSPRASTWESIQSQIVNIKYPARARPAYALISVATILLSIIPMSVSDGYFNITNSKVSKLAINTQDLGEQESKSTLNVTDEALNDSDIKGGNSLSLNQIDGKDNSKIDNKPSNAVLLDRIISTTPEKITPEIEKGNTNYSISSMQLSRINYPSINVSDNLVLASKSSFIPNYSVGLHLVSQFSSHLNPLRAKIKASDEGEIFNPVTVGFDLSFEKYISSKNSVRINLRGNNVKSLQFNEQNTAKEMTLNYLSLDLFYSRKWSLDNSDKLYLKTNIGVFAGYAISKGVNYNEERVAYIEDGLRDIDFGNSIGLLLSRKLSNRMRLEVGATSQFGVMSIFKGTDVLPSNYFRSTSISYGLTVGITKEF
jgi:hypothetical protein